MTLRINPSASAPRTPHKLQPVRTGPVTDHAGNLLTVLLVLPAAALLLTPFGLIAAAAAEQPDLLRVLIEKPLVAVQLAAGLVVSLLFCALPFSRRVARREPGHGKLMTPADPDTMPDDQPLAA